MSAFLLSQQSFQSIADGLHTCEANDRYATADLEGTIEQVNKYINLNLFALGERYGDTDWGVKPHITEAKIFQGNRYPFYVQLLKTLKCLSYQCSEGEAINHEDFTELQRDISRVAVRILEEECPDFSALYEDAEWGLY